MTQTPQPRPEGFSRLCERTEKEGSGKGWKLGVLEVRGLLALWRICDWLAEKTSLKPFNPGSDMIGFVFRSVSLDDDRRGSGLDLGRPSGRGLQNSRQQIIGTR